jgi:UDP-2,3-diacylglucosamine hydrolase
LSSEAKTAVFISDVHLKGVDDPRTAPFSEFLRSFKGTADVMVIVGDLFDFYYGFKSVVYWQHLPALAAFEELTRSGMRLVFVEGNHEFRIAEAMRGAFGMETFVGEGEITIAGKRIFLCHGDLADPKDYGYRFLHWALRNPLTAACASITPPSFAMAVARLASDQSRAHKAGRGERLTKLFRTKAETALRAGYDAAIFGHSHWPVLETIDVSGRSGTFANCGDWVEHFTYLRFDGSRFTLEKVDPVLKPAQASNFSTAPDPNAKVSNLGS